MRVEVAQPVEGGDLAVRGHAAVAHVDPLHVGDEGALALRDERRYVIYVSGFNMNNVFFENTRFIGALY